VTYGLVEEIKFYRPGSRLPRLPAIVEKSLGLLAVDWMQMALMDHPHLQETLREHHCLCGRDVREDYPLDGVTVFVPADFVPVSLHCFALRQALNGPQRPA
jgi:hypothetical protein